VEHLADFDAATQQIVPGRVASIIFSKKVESAAVLSDSFGQLRPTLDSCKSLKKLAGTTRLELATSAVTD
jgi:hypothetical protein